MKRRTLASTVFAAVLWSCLAAQPSAHALNIGMDNECAKVEAIWARGSGQATSATEAMRFRSQLETRITDPLTLHVYELGENALDGGYGSHSYKAIDVDNVWNGNPLGAKFSAGYANDYGKSVDSGVGELYNYIKQRQDKCGTSRFVLGGYSQGAQVVGQTIEKLNTEAPAVLDRVDFAALFGDPKLYLPEGEGFNPPACRGSGSNSAWRRDVPDCATDNGSLGARKPYLPSLMTNRVGLWCHDADFVCGSDKNPFTTSGHMTYGAVAGAIDDAVREIANRLAKTLPEESRSGLNTSIEIIGTGTTGVDVAFLVDTTGSMSSDINEAKAFARSAAALIRDMRGRVALVAYRDAGDSYTAKVFSGLQNDLTEFQVQLDSLTAGGGGDTPEAVLHALKTTMNSLDWRPGATKAAVILTDAGFHDPDVVDGSTLASVAALSLTIDPVNVYPVVPSSLTSLYKPLADETSGQVITNSGDTAAALTTALTKIKDRPVVLLPLTDYYGQPGDSFTFDASKSYVIDSTFTGYEWDFNGDGKVDQTTSAPTATHIYETAFDGTMQVRVTAANGGVANGSARIHVGGRLPDADLPDAPTKLAATPLSTEGGMSTVRLSWSPADAKSARWAVMVDGTALGTVDATTTTVEITDVDRAKDTEFAVAGINTDGEMGTRAIVLLPKDDPSEAIAPTTRTRVVGEGKYVINGVKASFDIKGKVKADRKSGTPVVQGKIRWAYKENAQFRAKSVTDIVTIPCPEGYRICATLSGAGQLKPWDATTRKWGDATSSAFTATIYDGGIQKCSRHDKDCHRHLPDAFGITFADVDDPGETDVLVLTKGGTSVTASLTKAPVPVIEGSSQVGQRLTLVSGEWTPMPIAFSYQWYRNGRRIKRATNTTYELQQADRGRVITVRVKATKPGYFSLYLTSQPTSVVS